MRVDGRKYPSRGAKYSQGEGPKPETGQKISIEEEIDINMRIRQMSWTRSIRCDHRRQFVEIKTK